MPIRTKTRLRRHWFTIGIVVVVAVTVALTALLVVVITKNNQMEAQISRLENTNQNNARKAWATTTEIHAGTRLVEGINIAALDTLAEIDPAFFWEGGSDYIAAVDLRAGVPIFAEMVAREEQGLDLHEMEYSCIQISSNISVNDYIDVRIVYPDGTNQIVLSKKAVKALSTENTVVDLAVNEEDMQLMTSAVVDMALYEGTYLYAAKYMYPASQQASVVTYVPSVQTAAIIASSPNIAQQINQYLNADARQKKEEGLALFMAGDDDYQNGQHGSKRTLAEILGGNVIEGRTGSEQADR